MSSPLLSCIQRFCLKQGWSLDDALRHQGYDPVDVRTHITPLTLTDYLALVESLAAQHHCPDIALQLGRDCCSEDFGLFGSLVATSNHLSEALIVFAAYQPLLHLGFTLDMQLKLDKLVLTLKPSPDFPLSQHRFGSEVLFSALIAQGQHFCGKMIPVHQVTFQHAAPTDITLYQRHFGTDDVAFNAPQNSLSIAAAWLYQPFLTANARYHQYLGQQARQLGLNEPNLLQDISAYLQRHLADPLACKVEAVAQYTRRSRRSLQRDLHQAGVNFSQLLQQLRHRQARQLLRDTTMTIEQIARQIGFRQPSSFNEQFRKWEQMTPSQYRQQNLAQSP